MRERGRWGAVKYERKGEGSGGDTRERERGEARELRDRAETGSRPEREGVETNEEGRSNSDFTTQIRT